jgi:hypothetical protein
VGKKIANKKIQGNGNLKAKERWFFDINHDMIKELGGEV